MRRRLIFFICFVWISKAAYANGFYVGIGAGPEFADFNQNAHIIIQPPGLPIVANIKDAVKYSGRGAMGSLFGGYYFTKQNFYLAGEVGVDEGSVLSSTSNVNSVSGANTATKYRMRNSVNVSVLPGFLCTDFTVFYARLGYSNGNFKVSTTDVSLANINRHLGGLYYGVGVQHMFSPHISARLEYDQAAYEATQFFVVTGPVRKTTNISNSTSQAMLGLIYTFV